MKIAFILPSLINQGPIIVVQNIVQELQKKGTVEIDIYYFDAKFGAKFNCPTYQITMKQAIDRIAGFIQDHVSPDIENLVNINKSATH